MSQSPFPAASPPDFAEPPSARERRWHFYVDRGGTFTDVIGLDPETGRRHVLKVLSSDRAPLVGIRRILGLEPHQPIPPSVVRMGTTLATNALLERRGVKTLLVITRGFADLLTIGNQTRPDLFALHIAQPTPLHQEVLEVDARLDPSGNVLDRPEREPVQAALAAARARGLESVAISVLHAHRSPELELELRTWARSAGFDHTTCSHECSRGIGFLQRTQTAVLDAYLTPLLTGYLTTLSAALPGSELLLMQSSGSLVPPERFRGPAALLSGPAGGVIASAEVARSLGAERAIGFDMGGTSTDVSRFAGEHQWVYETRIAGIDVVAPMLRIHTIAAGGGSVCRYDGHSLTVGPESAGAVPGPLCYGDPSAHELTLTDVNLVLGRLRPERFPFALDEARARKGLADIAGRLALDGHALSVEAVALGFLAIADASMAEAVHKVSLERGHDVRRDTLVVIGGAGGQHGCSVAHKLGIRRLLFHPLAGVLSAHGMSLGERGYEGERDLGRPVLAGGVIARCEPAFAELEAEALALLGARPAPIFERKLDLRYAGTETTLTLDYETEARLLQRFNERHREQFGFASETEPVLVARLRLHARSPRAATVDAPLTPRPMIREPIGYDRVHCQGHDHPRVPIYARETLHPGFEVDGPACIVEDTGTIVVDPGFRLRVDTSLVLEIEDTSAPLASVPSYGAQADAEPDPVQLRLASNAFMNVAEQMGVVLQKTARSTNIRERLDFSCAVFDHTARLIANAPHIPVHLGAMSESVRAVRERYPEAGPGDVFVTNDPAEGGSHLPDITVVTPLFLDGALAFYVANRGHHADIGGQSPGSMPAFSTTLEQEGVVLQAQPIVRAGVFLEAALREQLAAGAYPARNPDQNIADLKAQVAANAFGLRALERAIGEHGKARLLAYARYVQDDAARWLREELQRIGDRVLVWDDRLDDGTPVGVTLRVHQGTLDVHFRCGPEHRGNANAPRAVTMSALIYVLRCLSGRHLPLNAGCLDPVTVHIPEPSLLAPARGRAVVSGNVETSQRLVDVLLGAFGRVAASQGTMNNLTLGNAEFAYYETLGGGSGAGPGFSGASGVQCHMTNTRITDVEVLEATAPLRVVRFALRRGSGGDGQGRGGDGLVRELLFLAPLELSIVSERRTTAPFGLQGGAPGQPGKNRLNGRELGGRHAGRVEPGDRLCIETPGGGGYGLAVASGATSDGPRGTAPPGADAPPSAEPALAVGASVAPAAPVLDAAELGEAPLVEPALPSSA